MAEITVELLRKRAEHNEGMLSSLEEISLHQEELQSINSVLATCCRQLKILYLQNNLIPRLENLHHMRSLEYLNVALNNLTYVSGLGSCEFLRKLDLSINFIDCDTLADSITHLTERFALRELYLMGNPSMVNWPGCRDYVIARLPQLTTLDGTEITRSMQISARQELPRLEKELEKRANEVRAIKTEKAAFEAEGIISIGDDEMTDNTPETRTKIYQELAQQKKEKEERQRANLPKERNYEREQEQSLEDIRKKEANIDESEVKQKNEGGWDFFWDEDSKPGHVILEVKLQRHLDSSLVDVDVHPTYVSMVIKSKLLRLKTPAEVVVSTSKCQRSKTTGHLSVIMPKLNPRENAVTVRVDKRLREEQAKAQQRSEVKDKSGATRIRYKSTNSTPKLSLQEQLLAEAMQGASLTPTLTGTVDVANIVRRKEEPSTLDSPESRPTLPESAIVELD